MGGLSMVSLSIVGLIERLNSVQQKTLRERKVFHNVHC